MRTFEAWDGWSGLRAEWAGRLAEAELAELDGTVAFAERWHGEQKRPAGEPYVTHLLEALRVLVEGAGTTDIDVLRAGVLHDVVEDTDCTPEEVRDRFGNATAELVGWVTIPPRRADQSKQEVRDAYLDRLRGAPDDALMVKLSDRVSNVQRLDTHPRREKAQAYYRETVSRILPLAERVPFVEHHPWYRDWFGAWRTEFSWLSEEP